MLPTTNIILADHKVQYLGSGLLAYPAALVITSNGLYLQVDYSGALAGILFNLLPKLKSALQHLVLIFKLKEKSFSARRGEFGRNKNVLEIISDTGDSYKIVVADLDDWLYTLNNYSNPV